MLSCWSQFVPQKLASVVFGDLGACCAASTSDRAAAVCAIMCVCLCETRRPHIFLCVFYCPQTFCGKAFLVQKAQRAGPELCCSLFTALACDGGATPSLPITDCHFDGDATGGEQQPESIPLKHCLLPGRSRGRIRAQGHTLPCTHTHTKTLYSLYVYSSACFVLNSH